MLHNPGHLLKTSLNGTKISLDESGEGAEDLGERKGHKKVAVGRRDE